MMLAFGCGAPLLPQLDQGSHFGFAEFLDGFLVVVGELLGDENAGSFEALDVRGFLLRFRFGFGWHMDSLVNYRGGKGRTKTRTLSRTLLWN
jgi:hypothetical protein